MMCEKCKVKKGLRRLDVLGTGLCEKHGRFSFTDRFLNEPCPSCAKEKGICQKCGVKIC